MADWSRLLQEFEFPHTQRGGVTLVSRADANACVELIYAQGWKFLGYDSFTVSDQGITPTWSGRKIGVGQALQTGFMFFNNLRLTRVTLRTMSLCSGVRPNNSFKPRPLRGSA